jgi:cytochrome oxidase Cu insertion factor (SCO1/SenC/PrrC family)
LGDRTFIAAKFSVAIFTTVALLVFAFFAYGVFYVARQLPASAAAPRVRQKAPDFTLPDQNGRPVGLADLISGKGALLIFYRGYW